MFPSKSYNTRTKMIRIWLAFISTILFSFSAMASPSLSPTGRWKTIDERTKKPQSIIQIWEKNGLLYAKIEKILQPNAPPNPVCRKCEGNLKNKPLLEMTIIRDLKQDGEKWSGGYILDPSNGKTYRCQITLKENGTKLEVRRFIGISLFGRTQIWLREPTSDSGLNSKQ